MRSRVYLENGIVHTACADGEHDHIEAEAVVQRAQDLVKQTGRPGLLVVHLQRRVEVTADARKLYMDLLQSALVHRVAIIGPSAFQRTMANLILGMFAGMGKCKVVSDLAKGLVWLDAGRKIELLRPEARAAAQQSGPRAVGGS